MDLELITKIWDSFDALNVAQQGVTLALCITVAVLGVWLGQGISKRKVEIVDLENSSLKDDLRVEHESYMKEKQEAGELYRKNKELENTITKYEREVELIFKDGLYYLPEARAFKVINDHMNNGPYCVRCWELEKIRVSLQKRKYIWVCPSEKCNFVFQHKKT